MNEMDLEDQFSPETGYQRQRRGVGQSAISPPPIEDEDELAYIHRSARSGAGSLLPPPPTEDYGGSALPPPPKILSTRKAHKVLGAYKAETNKNGDAINHAAETLPSEDGTLHQSTGSPKDSKPQKKATKRPSNTTARKTGDTPKGGKQTSSQSSRNSSAPLHTQTENNEVSGLVWTILNCAYLLIGFPIFLLTFLFCGLIDEVLDIGFEGNNPLGKAARWSWDNLKISFYYWRKIGIIVAAIIIIIVIIEALF